MTPARATAQRRLPGVDGLWVFIGFDAVIFALLFASFMSDRRGDPELFEVSRRSLNFHVGGLNTLVLLTSSWLVALAVQAAKRAESNRVAGFLLGGMLTGALFVIVKSAEYAVKLSDGINPGSDTFFTWYFVLTGVHLTHVVVGTALLCWVWRRSRRRRDSPGEVIVLECVASFWHLVDLLWLVLFPLLYLQR